MMYGHLDFMETSIESQLVMNEDLLYSLRQALRKLGTGCHTTQKPGLQFFSIT